MGKKQLGELQPFELAITLIVADIATTPITDITLPITYGIIPIFTLFILHLLLTKLSKRSIKLRQIINGKPSIIITPEGINTKAISDLDMNINDLNEALRGQGYLSPSEINYAIAETNGDITFIPKASNKPVTLSDLNIAQEETTIPYTVVCEGKKMSENIVLCGLKEEDLLQVMQNYLLKLKDVLLFSIADLENIYIQPYNKPCIITKLSEEIK
ncbi:MAG: DUF421 domain-containing protein [Clostridia bacterium]